MSVERRERRRCDICGELITGDYFSCARKRILECPIPNPGHWVNQVVGDGIMPIGTYGASPYQPTKSPDLDVCLDCWDKMKEGEHVARSKSNPKV